MGLDLTSVRAKLARSQEHAQAIKKEFTSWSERYPYSIVKQVNADSTRYSLILRVNEPPPFHRWTCMVGDCLNNLRASLDHLVYTIASHEAAPNPPSYEGSLAFPITDCRPNFDEAINRHRLGNISSPIVAKIESLQPYNRAHPTLPPLLTILRDLNNADKHKLLRLVYSAIGQGNVGFVGNFPDDGRVWTPVPSPTEIEDGAEVFAMVCDRPTPNMNFDRTILDVIIAIWHGKRDPVMPDGMDRSDVISVLRLIAEEVRAIIYEIDRVIV